MVEKNLVVDLSYLHDVAYKLATAISQGHYSDIWYYEVHTPVNPKKIYNCIEGWENYQIESSALYKLFLDQHLVDNEPANISIAVKIADKWFIAEDAGANYYAGYGPRGIYELRQACQEIGIVGFFHRGDFSQWCKENIPALSVKTEDSLAHEFDSVLKSISRFSSEVQNRRDGFSHLKEENIRDAMMPSLNTIFPKRVSAESKVVKGHTDILIYSKKKKHHFVFELKIWGGIEKFKNTVKVQIPGYLTWENEYAGIIVFSRQKNFTNIIETVKRFLKTEYELISIGESRETELRFKMNYPTDEYRPVYVHVTFVNLT